MTYYDHSKNTADPKAVISPSISWESAGWISLNTPPKEVVENDGGKEVGGTLRADVMTTVSGTEIPSYNCSAVFNFTASEGSSVDSAVNSVSWTCSSEPAPVWRTYQHRRI